MDTPVAHAPSEAGLALIEHERDAPRWALWLSVPIAALGLLASVAGLAFDGTYAAETDYWAGQAMGQDAVNLVVFPALVLLAWRAGRGSLRAYLGWLGLLAYSAYSYVLYAGYVHFTGWFLVYVATLGLSLWALIGGLAALDPTRVRAGFEARTPTRLTGAVLAGLGALYALLWLSEIVPASLDGTTPTPVVDAGLPTNPVWVLDLGVVLPAMIAAGVLLRRGRSLGYALAGPLLAFGVAMGVAILGMFVGLRLVDEPVELAPVVLIGLTVGAQLALLWRYLAGLRAGTSVADVLRPAAGAPIPAADHATVAAPR